MGEHADAIIEGLLFNSWGEPVPYRRAPTEVQCRKCDKRGLRWQNVKGGGWRVHERSGGLHKCDGHFSYVEEIRGLTRQSD